MVTIMTQPRLASPDERIIEPMLALARCSKLQRIIVAGSKGIELMFVLHRRGYLRAAASANCGHAAGQYDVALVDWRQRSIKALDATLGWLVNHLSPAAVLVVWVDPQKSTGKQKLHSALERHGFRVEAGTVQEYGLAISARRLEATPISKAA